MLSVLGASGIVAAAALSLVAVVAWQDRLRVGLAFGLVPFCLIAGLAIVFARRRGLKELAEWTAILSISLALLPLAELAIYPIHWFQYTAARERATSPADDAAEAALDTVGRQTRNDITLYVQTALPGLTINLEGFRGPEFKPRDPATVRIVVMGASSVFGDGLEDQSALPVRLELRLRELLKRPVEVLNLGHPAITMATEARILQAWLSRLRPDVVVFNDGANDFAQHGWAPAFGWENWTLIVEDTLRNRLIDRVNQSVLRTRLRGYAVAPFAMPSAETQATVIRGAVASYTQGRTSAEAECRAQGVPCMFFIQPLITDRKTPTYSEINELKQRESAFRGYGDLYVRYADLIAAEHPPTTSLRNVVATDPRPLFLDWAHPTRAGNDLLADRIAHDVIWQLEGHAAESTK